MINSCRRVYKTVTSTQTRHLNLKKIISIWKPSVSAEMTTDRLIWIDMEMSGLDHLTDHILEVGCIITEANLKIVAEHPSIVIHQSDDVLSQMNDWCVKQHAKTGLTEASKGSTISLGEAEDKLLSFLQEYTPAGQCPLAGNSVYMDRYFLNHYMPRIDSHMHFRIVDVSSIGELCRRWNPKVFNNKPKKLYVHRASKDIKESIEELKYYKNFMFGSIST